MTDSFVCPTCGTQSFLRGDIANRYCGRCHTFADDVTVPKRADTPAEAAARMWLHAYGIDTERYVRGGGDHPAMRSLPQAFEAFAAGGRQETAHSESDIQDDMVVDWDLEQWRAAFRASYTANDERLAKLLHDLKVQRSRLQSDSASEKTP